MQIYRVLMTEDAFRDLSHEAYFQNKPTKEDVLESLKRDALVAPEYSEFYFRLRVLVEGFDWGDQFATGYREVGAPAENNGVKGYIRCGKFWVMENGKP